MQQPSFRQDRVAEPRVQRVARDEIHRTADRGREVVGEVLDLPAQPSPWCQVVEQIDIAVAALLTSVDRAEHLEACHAVASADLRDPLEVDLQAGDGQGANLRRAR